MTFFLSPFLIPSGAVIPHHHTLTIATFSSPHSHSPHPQHSPTHSPIKKVSHSPKGDLKNRSHDLSLKRFSHSRCSQKSLASPSRAGSTRRPHRMARERARRSRSSRGRSSPRSPRLLPSASCPPSPRGVAAGAVAGAVAGALGGALGGAVGWGVKRTPLGSLWRRSSALPLASTRRILTLGRRRLCARSCTQSTPCS